MVICVKSDTSHLLLFFGDPKSLEVNGVCGESIQTWRGVLAYRHYSHELKGGWKKEGPCLLALVARDRIRGNGYKIHLGRFRLDISKYFCPKRVIKH